MMLTLGRDDGKTKMHLLQPEILVSFSKETLVSLGH